MSFLYGPLNKSIHTQTLELLAKLMIHEPEQISISAVTKDGKNNYVAKYQEKTIDLGELFKKANLTHIQFNEQDGHTYLSQKLNDMYFMYEEMRYVVSEDMRFEDMRHVRSEDLRGEDFSFSREPIYRGLTHGEQIAIIDYTNDSSVLKDFLYQNVEAYYLDSPESLRITFLTAAMIASGLNKIDSDLLQQDSLYRGDKSFSEEQLNTYIAKVADEHAYTQSNNFLSTSTKEAIAGGFAEDMYIVFDASHAKDISGLSSFPGEHESLLNFGKIQWTSHDVLDADMHVKSTLHDPHLDETFTHEQVIPKGTHVFHAKTIEPLIPSENAYSLEELAQFVDLYEMAKQANIDLDFVTAFNKNLILSQEVKPEPMDTSISSNLETSLPDSSDASPLKNIEDYTQGEIVMNMYPANYVYKSTSLKDGSSWFVAIRHGEYSAQVDAAVGKIFQYYMPESPQVDMVYDQKNDDYYIASQAIENVGEFYEYPVTASFENFGKMSVLSYFVGETDFHSGNYVVQALPDDTFRALKIDNAESLSDEVIHNPVCLDDILDNHWDLPEQVTNSENYHQEQLETIRLIAKTPFEDIRDILTDTITASQAEESLRFLSKSLELGSFSDDPSQEAIIVKGIKDVKDAIEQGPEHLVDMGFMDLNTLLESMSQRHEAFKEIANQLEQGNSDTSIDLSAIQVSQPISMSESLECHPLYEGLY